MGYWLACWLGLQTVAGKAVVYWPGDRNSGRRRADGRRFRRKDGHIAHRTLPLGTVGLLCNERSGRCLVTTVGDRGPFGALRDCKDPDGEVLPRPRPRRMRVLWRKGQCLVYQPRRRLAESWRWRSEFDLTRPASRGIGHRPGDVVSFHHGVSGRARRAPASRPLAADTSAQTLVNLALWRVP